MLPRVSMPMSAAVSSMHATFNQGINGNAVNPKWCRTLTSFLIDSVVVNKCCDKHLCLIMLLGSSSYQDIMYLRLQIHIILLASWDFQYTVCADEKCGVVN
jgi:hypothetical protein